MAIDVEKSRALYAGARPLRKFEFLGETFEVVRWRCHDKRLWRKYTALLHDGVCVADDIGRNTTDAELPYERQLEHVFKTREHLIAALRTLKGM